MDNRCMASIFKVGDRIEYVGDNPDLIGRLGTVVNIGTKIVFSQGYIFRIDVCLDCPIIYFKSKPVFTWAESGLGCPPGHGVSFSENVIKKTDIKNEHLSSFKIGDIVKVDVKEHCRDWIMYRYGGLLNPFKIKKVVDLRILIPGFRSVPLILCEHLKVRF